MGGRHYDWVPVTEDMPPDRLDRPSESIVVLTKTTGSIGAHMSLAFYDNVNEVWCTAKTGKPLKHKVLAWTSDYFR